MIISKMCLCCRKKERVADVIEGLQRVRNRSTEVKSRDWETRNKFRCIFCGGASCKHEDWTRHKNPAIQGLNSDWITDSILATQRLSSRIISEHNIISQFKAHNLTSVFNLQLPGEHPYCGDGLLQNRAFTYTPEELYENGLFFYNIGWPDMHTPSISKMADLVQMMSLPIERNEKIAVHCHAGYGRTGCAIACFLLYTTDLDPDKAIACVRSKRPKCIQTSKQQKFVHEFYKFLVTNRQLFPETRLSLQEHYYHQTVLIHGNTLKTIDSVPKLVYEVCKLVVSRIETAEYMPEQVSAAFYNYEMPVFTNPSYLALLGVIQTNDYIVSVDETAMNSPAVTLIEQMEKKLHKYKYQLNCWSWNEFLEEKDVRVCILLLLDWIENYLLDPIINSEEMLIFFERCCKYCAFKYQPSDKASISKIAFKTIEKIVNCLLVPIYGKRDFKNVINRLVIAFLGVKEKWIESFEGKKLKKLSFREEIDVSEIRVQKILLEWTKSINNN